MTTTFPADQRFATQVHEDGVIVFDTTDGHLFRLNPIGGQIWARLSEQESLEAIASEISAEYGMPRDVVVDDVRDFVSRLRQHSLLSRRHAI